MWLPRGVPGSGGSGRAGVVQKDSAVTSQWWPGVLPRKVLELLTAAPKGAGFAP